MRTDRSNRLWRFAGWSILAVVVIALVVASVAYLLGAAETAGRAFDIFEIAVFVLLFWMYRDMGRHCTEHEHPDQSDVAP